MKKHFSLLLIATLQAQELNAIIQPKNINELNERELLQIQQNNQQAIIDLQKAQKIIDTPSDSIEKLIQEEQRIKHAMNQFSSYNINKKPVFLPITSTDEIFFHPYFQTEIILPRGAKITRAESVDNLIKINVDYNTATVKVSPEFLMSNFTLYYEIHNEKRLINIFAKRYIIDSTNNKLNLVYYYQETKPRRDDEILSAFLIANNNQYPKDDISYVKLDGIIYRIIKDKEHGKIWLGEQKYRIDQNIGSR